MSAGRPTDSQQGKHVGCPMPLRAGVQIVIIRTILSITCVVEGDGSSSCQKKGSLPINAVASEFMQSRGGDPKPFW